MVSIDSVMRSMKVCPSILRSGFGYPIRRDSPAANRIPSKCVGIDARLLRALEVAEADAESELVALFGAALANNFGDDRDCDFFGRLTTNRNPERRVNVGEAIFGNTARADSFEGGLNPAAR